MLALPINDIRYNPIFKNNEIEFIRKYKLKKSNIKNAGLGCFSRIFIKKGDLLDEYYGLLTSLKKITPKNLDRSWRVTSDLILDGTKILYYKNPLMYANGCSIRSDFKLMNTIPEILNNSILYFASKNIYAGDEIIIDYGRQYFVSRGLPYNP